MVSRRRFALACRNLASPGPKVTANLWVLERMKEMGRMNRSWLLGIFSTVLTLAVCLALLRWLAPGLLGAPMEMKIVQSDEKLPPFFEAVFGGEGASMDEFLLQDPVTRVRGKPLYPAHGTLGPHDLLGFRNHVVPRIADLVIIGDSQTYGNNAVLLDNWPSQMARSLNRSADDVYSMAVGGWGAVQYLSMYDKAVRFRPRVLVVAFYSGNDPLDSFHMAYWRDEWARLRPDTGIRAEDSPPVTYPTPRDQWWEALFSDGTGTIFTPTLRLASNSDHPVIHAGWGVMANVALEILRKSHASGIRVLFTIIPTKELVYAGKVAQQGLTPPHDYSELVKGEEVLAAA